MNCDRKEISHILGLRIRKLRTERNISREALAFSLGVHTTYIGKTECGEKRPSIDTLYKSAKSLNVSVSELLDIV